MPYKLVEPIEGRWRHYRVRGTERGVYLDRTTKTSNRDEAQQILAEWRKDPSWTKRCAAPSGSVLEAVADALQDADKGLPPQRTRSRYINLARVAIAAMSVDDGKEDWLPIEGFPGYEVGSSGSVRRALKGGRKITLNPSSMKTGHLKLSIYRKDKQLTTMVHRLVCRAFNGPPPFLGAVVRHLNGIPNDNRPDNLMWGTVKENTADMMRHREERRLRRQLVRNPEENLKTQLDQRKNSLGKGGTGVQFPAAAPQITKT